MNLSSFFCTQLNSFKYCYVSLIIHLNICLLFTQLNDEIVLFLTIQFRISHLFALSLNVKRVLFNLSSVTTPGASIKNIHTDKI